MNKATRILENMTLEERTAMETAIGVIPDNADVGGQAGYINNLLNCAKKKNVSVEDTMRKCGGNCLEQSIIDTAKDIYGKAADMEDFLAELNKTGIGGGNLRIDNGKVIAAYKECYCDIPHAVKKINPMYCQCSAGWFQSFFSAVLGKAVPVKIIDTITNGASECTFEIYCL